MPIDPMIARGVEPLTFGNTLMQISALKQRDRSLDQDAQYQNALMQDRQQARTDQQAMRTADDEEDAAWEAAIQAGDLDGAFRIDPQATSLYANWKKSQEPAAPIEFKKTPWGGQYAEQGGQRVPGLEYNPPAPQQYGPESFSSEVDADGNLILVGNRGTIRETGRKGSKGGGENVPGSDLNPRQKTGMNMIETNLLMYAASRSGKSRDEIERIYASQGPKGVGDLIRNAPARSVQGGVARFLQEIPFGSAIVDANNPDLVASRKGAGAGMAAFQNSTGPITAADFTVGEAQVPSATYPQEVQADIIEQRLREVGGFTGRDSQGASGGSGAGGDPLAQYAGQTITQNGKRYLVIQGANGRHFAQELK
jgi:hypothetical protein